MILLFKIFQYSNHINPYTKSEGLGIGLIVPVVVVESKKLSILSGCHEKGPDY